MTLWQRRLLWSSPTSYQQQSVTGCISERTAAEEKWNDKTFTSFIRLCKGCLFSLQYFSIHQPCSHIGKTGKTCSFPRALYCRRAYGQAAEQWLHLQGLYLCSNEIQLGNVTVVCKDRERLILLCHLAKRERSSMSQTELCGGGTSE